MRELVDASFRLIAPKKLIKQLDEADRRPAAMLIGDAMSFASPFPEVDIPSTSVYDYLFGDIDDTDLDRVALVDAKSGRETTYREMIGRIDAFAGALAARGIGVGDIVGLLSPNSSAFAVAFHGILRSGATATTINALFTPKDIAKQLTDSKAKMLVTATALLSQAEEAAAAVGLPAENHGRH